MRGAIPGAYEHPHSGGSALSILFTEMLSRLPDAISLTNDGEKLTRWWQWKKVVRAISARDMR
jgi:hypothetical protein